MRGKTGFEYKEAVDGVLKTAMTVLGPEVLFKVLPLNLEPEDRLVAFYILAHSLTNHFVSIAQLDANLEHTYCHCSFTTMHLRLAISFHTSSPSPNGCSIYNKRRMRKDERPRPRCGVY